MTSSPIPSSPRIHWEPEATITFDQSMCTIKLKTPDGCSSEDILISQFARNDYDELRVTILNDAYYVWSLNFLRPQRLTLPAHPRVVFTPETKELTLYVQTGTYSTEVTAISAKVVKTYHNSADDDYSAYICRYRSIIIVAHVGFSPLSIVVPLKAENNHDEHNGQSKQIELRTTDLTHHSKSTTRPEFDPPNSPTSTSSPHRPSFVYSPSGVPAPYSVNQANPVSSIPNLPSGALPPANPTLPYTLDTPGNIRPSTGTSYTSQPAGVTAQIYSSPVPQSPSNTQVVQQAQRPFTNAPLPPIPMPQPNSPGSQFNTASPGPQSSTTSPGSPGSQFNATSPTPVTPTPIPASPPSSSFQPTLSPPVKSTTSPQSPPPFSTTNVPVYKYKFHDAGNNQITCESDPTLPTFTISTTRGFMDMPKRSVVTCAVSNEKGRDVVGEFDWKAKKIIVGGVSKSIEEAKKKVGGTFSLDTEWTWPSGVYSITHKSRLWTAKRNGHDVAVYKSLEVRAFSKNELATLSFLVDIPYEERVFLILALMYHDFQLPPVAEPKVCVDFLVSSEN
ncbi:hypothetical protein NP233_g7236 [Leucocoprinus birnbaumii]|uniref:Uncharacterized protein n=1 Tax=Leucocoprinus birnbaumii TaxID=56174 RepID=A0AAD5VS93_9AGAR|nr:hypothetical protein NP233_g7236 [Leucocoprinus birnbaumii]